MTSTRLLLGALLALSSATVSHSAWAADDYEDLDAPSGGKDKKSRDRKIPDEVVREIVRGTYAKASVGGAFFLGSFSGFISPGTYTSMTVGNDFVDRDRLSMAGELSFSQGIHNGCLYTDQAYGYCPGNAAGKPSPLVQGDLRTYTLSVALEGAIYPTKRIGLGLRGGGGILFAPLLMDRDYYNSEVVSGTWGGQAGTYHDSPHPIVSGGPTFEYYTKLAHFSVGVDADVFYAIGLDLGASVTGSLKYTF